MMAINHHHDLKRAYDKLKANDKLLQHAKRDIRNFLFAAQAINRNGTEEFASEVVEGNYDDHFRGLHEWYQEEDRKHVFSHPEILKFELNRLRGIKRRLENADEALQTHINVLSRPFLRQLHILDMPDELLTLIFEFVASPNPKLFKKFPSVWGQQGSKDIARCRMTCRRFCQVSSPMFINYVNVSLTDQSLARLVDISSHPTISKGVLAVIVLLSSYSEALYDSIGLFVDYWADTLEERIELHRTNTDQKVVREANELVASWRRFISASPNDHQEPQDCTHHDTLKELHAEYRRRYENQERLRQTGHFAHTVASAMTRMPRAQILEFSQHDQSIPLSTIGAALVFDFGAMLEPFPGNVALDHGYYPVVLDLVPGVLAAAGRVGARLEAILISLTYIADSHLLLPSPDALEDLRSATQRTKCFEFECNDWFYEQDSNNIGELLRACLDAPLLEKLSLDMSTHRPADDSFIGDVSQVITCNKWSKLREANLVGVAVDLTALGQFIRNLPPVSQSLYIMDVYLTEGTWESALDELRKISYKELIINYLKGGELDTLSHERLTEIFGNPWLPENQCSKAWLYARNDKYTTCNPFREEIDLDLA